jgi:hypothetical protein
MLIVAQIPKKKKSQPENRPAPINPINMKTSSKKNIYRETLHASGK